MNKPSNLAQRRLNAAKEDSQAHYLMLTALADEAAFLMRYFLDRDYDYDTALTLTEVTLDRKDQKEK